MDSNDRIRTEWIILADYAEVINGKLYLMGGGWDRLTVNSGFPVTQQCGIAVSFRVPWSLTNQTHHFELEVADDDGKSLVQADGYFEVARPPGSPPGQPQRFQFSMNGPVQFEHPGGYVIIARSDGEEIDRSSFAVVSARPLPAH
jgi:hypothetical protein